MRPVSAAPSAGVRAARPLSRRLLAPLCGLLGLGLCAIAAPAATQARADDAGMMSFLLNGNSNRVASMPAAPVFARPVQLARSPRIIAVRHMAQRPKPHKMRYAERPAIAPPVRVASLGPVAPLPVARPAEYRVPLRIEPHLTDETLRRGDIVATEAGLRVFAGGDHFPYVDRDFLSLSRAQLSQHRTMLDAIDRRIRHERAALAPDAPQEPVDAIASKTARLGKSTPADRARPDNGAKNPPVQRAALSIAPARRDASYKPYKKRLQVAWRARHRLSWKTRHSPVATDVTPVRFWGYGYGRPLRQFTAGSF